MNRPKGLNHVAYVTKDTAATTRFYTEVLGMKLVGHAIDDSVGSRREESVPAHVLRDGDGSSSPSSRSRASSTTTTTRRCRAGRAWRRPWTAWRSCARPTSGCSTRAWRRAGSSTTRASGTRSTLLDPNGVRLEVPMSPVRSPTRTPPRRRPRWRSGWPSTPRRRCDRRAAVRGRRGADERAVQDLFIQRGWGTACPWWRRPRAGGGLRGGVRRVRGHGDRHLPRAGPRADLREDRDQRRGRGVPRGVHVGAVATVRALSNPDFCLHSTTVSGATAPLVCSAGRYGSRSTPGQVVGPGTSPTQRSAARSG